MPEIRFEAGDQDVAVLDRYCSARGKCRTEVIKQILAEWSQAKLHEQLSVMADFLDKDIAEEAARILARGIVAAFYDFKVAHERMTRFGINGKDRE